MFYDLNVPWTTNSADLQRTLSFLAELGYDVIALNYTSTGQIPADLKPPIPKPLPFPVPPGLSILRRVTVTLDSPSQNPHLPTIAPHCDILSLRPTCEKTLLQAVQSPACDLISLDLGQRFPFHFRPKNVCAALTRGLRFEICYAAAKFPEGSGVDAQAARRNLIMNATSLIRALRGRGVVVSSEARRVGACVGPWDAINLAAVWGLKQEVGREAVGRAARSVVVQARMKRTSFRGVVDVIYGGEKPAPVEDVVAGNKTIKQGANKRKALETSTEGGEGEEKPLSKRQQKKRAREARLEAVAALPTGDSIMDMDSASMKEDTHKANN